MISSKSISDIEKLKIAGGMLTDVFREVLEAVKPGVTGKDLELIADKAIKNKGANPSFKGYLPKSEQGKPFPASICISPNEYIVHGIPRSDQVFQEGDIVGLDLGLELDKMYVDAALTVPVGKIDEKAKELLRVCWQALKTGEATTRIDGYIGDIGASISSFVNKDKNHYGVIRDLAGHGVGFAVHEAPLVPNYGQYGNGDKIINGTVIAIEPMITEGKPEIFVEQDEWSIRTKDKSRSAHFEETVCVTNSSVIILTPLENLAKKYIF